MGRFTRAVRRDADERYEERFRGVANMDAAESVHFNRSIEQVKVGVYETRYPAFHAREFIPVATGISPNAKVLTWRRFDQVGIAKVISGYSRDLPRADAFATEESMTVRTLGNSYGYNIEEIRASLEDGTNLEQRKGNAARRAHEQLVETIAFSGDSTHNLLGLSNQPNAQLYTVPTGASGQTTWDAKTPDEILTDLFAIGDLIVTTTRGAEKPDTLILPQFQYSLISRTRLDVYNPESILQHFTQTSSHIKNVGVWDLLDGAGVGATDRMVAYTRSPDVLELVIPREFEQLDGQARDLEVVIPCLSRTGGVRVFVPLAMAYGDGI
jgi:hypothetical protein